MQKQNKLISVNQSVSEELAEVVWDLVNDKYGHEVANKYQPFFKPVMTLMVGGVSSLIMRRNILRAWNTVIAPSFGVKDINKKQARTLSVNIMLIMLYVHNQKQQFV